MPSLSPSSNLSENPNGNPVLTLDSSFNPWDFSLSTQLPRDDDNGEDEDDDGNEDDGGGNDNDNYDDNLIDVNDNDNLMRLQTFDLNNIEGMSEYEVLRLRRIRRNEAKLTSLGLLEPMPSAASLSSDRSNSKKRSAPQDDVERQVQPTPWLAMSANVSVGYTPQTTDIFVCRRHVGNVVPTRRRHSVMSANFLRRNQY